VVADIRPLDQNVSNSPEQEILSVNTIDYGPAIESIALAIDEGRLSDAREIAFGMPRRIKRSKISRPSPDPITQHQIGGVRKYNERDLMSLFRRDGFIDRYTGLRLVTPPALRAISVLIPDAFPFHPNWKEGACHDSYWDLSATADHVKPVAEGGQDDIENLVSTCMSVNLQKNSISLEELGWKLFPVGSDSEWDGLSGFFLSQCERQPVLLETQYFKDWFRAVES